MGGLDYAFTCHPDPRFLSVFRPNNFPYFVEVKKGYLFSPVLVYLLVEFLLVVLYQKSGGGVDDGGVFGLAIGVAYLVDLGIL